MFKICVFRFISNFSCVDKVIKTKQRVNTKHNKNKIFENV